MDKIVSFYNQNSIVINVCIGLFFAILIPLLTLLISKKKTHAKLWVYIAGAICFALFVVLEGLFNNFVSKFFHQGPVWAFALYGGFMAGLFEETGRLFGFKVLLRKRHDKGTGIAYGFGHGGMEVLLIVGVTYLIYLLFLVGAVSSGNPFVDYSVILQAASLTPALIGVAFLERIIAITLHVGLSMIMFHACEKNLRWYLPSVLLHTLADFPAVYYRYGMLTLWQVEALCAVVAVLTLVIAIALYRKDNKSVN